MGEAAPDMKYNNVKTSKDGSDAITIIAHPDDNKTPDYYPFQPFLCGENAKTAFGALVLIWSFEWLYLGELWDPTVYVHKTHHLVVNCDVIPPSSSLNQSFVPYLSILAPQPLADVWLEASIYNTSSPISAAYDWVPTQCPNVQGPGCGTAEEERECLSALSDGLRRERAWGLVYFPSNFTKSVLSWYLTAGVAPQYQQVEMQYRFATGRDYTGLSFITGPIRQALVPGMNKAFVEAIARKASALPPVNPVFYAKGVKQLRVDVAPVRFFGQHFASYIFCLVLWLGSSFVVNVFNQFKLPAEAAWLDVDLEEKPSRGQLAKEVFLKGLLALVFQLVLAILCVSVIWGLGGNKAQWHKNAGYAIAFGWYLSWSFVSMNAILLHALGVERFSSFTAFLLILQFTSGNAVFHTVLSNPFFRIGKMFPFYYGTRGFRTIFFGVMGNRMWVNWLVFTGWNLAMAPLGIWFVSKRIVHKSALLHQRSMLMKEEANSRSISRLLTQAQDAGGAEPRQVADVAVLGDKVLLAVESRKQEDIYGGSVGAQEGGSEQLRPQQASPVAAVA